MIDGGIKCIRKKNLKSKEGLNIRLNQSNHSINQQVSQHLKVLVNKMAINQAFNGKIKSWVIYELEKLNKHSVDNDKKFLECLIDLDDRVKQLEKHHTPTDVGEYTKGGDNNV